MTSIDLRLHVVDRNTEVERLVRTAEFNKHLLDTEKPVLLYSSQVFGSGKSTFGVNAISLLQDPAVIQALLHPPSAANLPQDLIDMRDGQKFTQELVDSFLATRTIYVDLKKGLVESTNTNKISFKKALYHKLYCTAVGNISTKDFFAEIEDFDSGPFMDLLVRKTGHTGKWFFFIDEIGYMEQMAKEYPDINEPTTFDSNSKPKHIDGYTRLFDVLCPFLVRDDTFVFCAGKSAHLTSKCLKESGSPVRLWLLAMSPLQPQHIVEVLQKSTHKSQSLQQALGVTNNLLPPFAEILYWYTGGIPRLICRALESLLGKAPIPLDEDEIKKLMNEKVRDDILADTSSFFRPEYISADATKVYSTLLLMSVLRIKIKKPWVMNLGHGNTKFVLDWVSNLCLHISPDGPDTYSLVFSQYLIDYLQKYPPHGEQRIVFLAGLLDQLRSLPAVMDQGRILEVMIALSLGYHLGFATTFSNIPGLTGTVLSSMSVPKGIARGFGDIHFLPSFQSGTKKGAPHTEGGNIKSYNPEDWHLFFKDLITNNHMNTVGIVKEKNSHGPDLILPIQVAAHADPAQLPTKLYALGIASKNLQSDGATSWSDVEDEIEKGLTMPLKNKELKGKLEMVLVIASTCLMEQLKGIIGAPYRILGPGTWYYHKESKLEMKTRDYRGWEKKFTVPEGGQLVILSEDGMTALLGTGALQSLTNYFTHDDERCSNLLLLEHGILPHKRENALDTHTTTDDHKRKCEDADISDVPVTHTIPEKRKCEDNATSDALIIPSRMFKIKFVQHDSRTAIGDPAMAVVPFGTTLLDAQNILTEIFEKLNPTTKGHKVAGIEWEGVQIQADLMLEAVQHREQVVVLMKNVK